MDSLTQLALGAAVGEATLGRRIGRRALAWGALCGTLPDLDVFIPMGDAVRDFTYHRAASHSFFVLALLTPLVVWLILKLHPDTAEQRPRWFVLVFLVFATHVLLDSFTVYGTQIFWPFWSVPMSWSSIFIIDPLYTLPLLAGVGAALAAEGRSVWGSRLNTFGLVASSLYLAWTLGAKVYVEEVAAGALQRQGVVYQKLLTTPTPFNTLLWRVVAVSDEAYYEGFHSLLDDARGLAVAEYPRNEGLLRGLGDHWPVRRLRWFTKGFYAVSLHGRDIVMNDLRMGLEPDYVFRFKVGEISNPHASPSTAERLPGVRSAERLRWVWRRIWDSGDLGS